MRTEWLEAYGFLTFVTKSLSSLLFLPSLSSQILFNHKDARQVDLHSEERRGPHRGWSRFHTHREGVARWPLGLSFHLISALGLPDLRAPQNQVVDNDGKEQKRTRDQKRVKRWNPAARTRKCKEKKIPGER